MIISLFPQISNAGTIQLQAYGGTILGQDVQSTGGTVPTMHLTVVDTETQEPLQDVDVSVNMQFGDGMKTTGRSWDRSGKTDENGKVDLELVNEESTHEKNFIQIAKLGYHEAFIYKKINPMSEYAFAIAANQTLELKVGIAPIRESDKKKLVSGRFTVDYYAPDFQRCAKLGMTKIKSVYPKVKKLLQREVSPTTNFTFRTQIEQGNGDWTGGGDGISTTCFPWTDNTGLDQIKDMWRTAIPHELAHHFLSNIPNPYWAEEGIAQYVSHKINHEALNCSSEKLIPIEDLQGENMPQYESAACVWELLDKQYPGILVKTLNTVDAMKDGQDKNRLWDTDFFIKEVIRQAAGEKSSDSLVNFFMTKFHFSAQALMPPSNTP